MYYDTKRSKGPDFKKEDPIYLIRKNMKTKRLSSKLDFTKLKPFKIKEVINIINYRLKLLRNMRIYSVFHVSLLERTPISAKTTQIEVDPDEKYDIERIIGNRIERGKRFYLIK